jgi:signal transduction histidine kinase
MMFGWGEDYPGNYVLFYNDAAIPTLGDKHPHAMGRKLREVFPEFIDILLPLGNVVLKTSRPVALEDAKLVIHRHSRLEAAYFTFSFSAICDEQGRVCGILNTFVETTDRVLDRRRLRTARELAANAGRARSVEEACSGAISALALNRSDVPFALIYLSDRQGDCASLAGALGLTPGGQAAPRIITLDGSEGEAVWPLERSAHTGQPELVSDLLRRVGPIAEIGRPQQHAALVLPALVLPAKRTSEVRPSAFVIAGLNPHRPLDEAYRSFLELVSSSVGAGIANARADQETRERADRLAEIDRAKTVFLSNISHEFRTPLSLILGPIEDLLAKQKAALTPEQREQLTTVRRNALRLLRMVNDLLTFARIEAGRMEAFFEPVDLASLTRDLVGMFDSAATQAGLRLVVNCPPLPEPVYVDPELWERIVLNLVSNALKYTFEGQVVVTLRARPDSVELTVRDTGVGIPADELPHVFERFHRVHRFRKRTQEGTGIGLSLLRELARLHGGDASLKSVEGRGSTFTVEIPRGSAHLPQDRVGSARSAVSPEPEHKTNSLRDAYRWTRPECPVPPREAETGRPRILVAEDNADMRDYLEHLMAERYDIVTAENGAQALELARARPPDVVLSDVMMPVLDGLQLVSRLREDPHCSSVPIVLLSARTGEDAALEGLSRGADDYVVKPFSSRELLARIETHLELAGIRREVGQLKLKDEFMTIVSHELATPLTSMKLLFQQARTQLETAGLPEAALLARVDRAMSRIEKLIDDLLTLSLIKREELPLSTRTCDLVQICRQAVEDEAAATNRRVRCELPNRAVDAVVDPDAIGHVVSSLLANAVKFSAANQPVVLRLDEVDGEAVIAIRDQGPGIPADELSRLFERFYRVPGVEVKSGSNIGLGLGLYICKAIVQRHGGRIWAESTVGQGSTFSFGLPVTA